MHYILASVGSYGDIAPFVWMAETLKRQGHTVDFLANPVFEDRIAGAGIAFHPIGTGEDYRTAATPAAITGNPFRDNGERIRAARRLFEFMFLRPAGQTCDTVCAQATGETAVLHHFYAYGAKIAAEKRGLRHMNVNLSPYWLRTFLQPGSLSERMEQRMSAARNRFIDRQLFYKPVNDLRRRIGLHPIVKGSMEWMFGGRTICLYPEWLQDFPLRGDVNVSHIGFPGNPAEKEPLPQVMEDFLASRGRPVVFTPGSAVENGAAFFRDAAGALEDLGRPGVFLTRFPESIPEKLPENILHMDFAPLASLLDRCAAIVHHGGIGTCAQAMAAGIPQLICHRLDEQRENARILEKLGVCRSLPFDGADRRRLAEGISGIADGSRTRECRQVREKLAAESSGARLLSLLGHEGVWTAPDEI